MPILPEELEEIVDAATILTEAKEIGNTAIEDADLLAGVGMVCPDVFVVL